MRWLDGITDSMDLRLSELRADLRKPAGLSNYKEGKNKKKISPGNRMQCTLHQHIKELESRILIPKPRISSKICSSHKTIHLI